MKALIYNISRNRKSCCLLTDQISELVTQFYEICGKLNIYNLVLNTERSRISLKSAVLLLSYLDKMCCFSFVKDPAYELKDFSQRKLPQLIFSI